jgi:hypothetical protein
MVQNRLRWIPLSRPSSLLDNVPSDLTISDIGMPEVDG